MGLSARLHDEKQETEEKSPVVTCAFGITLERKASLSKVSVFLLGKQCHQNSQMQVTAESDKTSLRTYPHLRVQVTCFRSYVPLGPELPIPRAIEAYPIYQARPCKKGLERSSSRSRPVFRTADKLPKSSVPTAETNAKTVYRPCSIISLPSTGESAAPSWLRRRMLLPTS